MIKPDVASKDDGTAQAIIEKAKKAGFHVQAEKKMTLSKEQAEEFYAEHKDRHFFGELVGFMTRCQCNIAQPSDSHGMQWPRGRTGSVQAQRYQGLARPAGPHQLQHSQREGP